MSSQSVQVDVDAHSAGPWRPSNVRNICTRFAGRCFWCADEVPADSSAAFYVDEREVAHEACHAEACP